MEKFWRVSFGYSAHMLPLDCEDGFYNPFFFNPLSPYVGVLSEQAELLLRALFAQLDSSIMQVAAFLSDLKSLSVCPHQAAINLVSVHRTAQEKDQQSMKEIERHNEIEKSIDNDLQRADELVSLHQNVKLKYLESGLDAELLEARQAVGRVFASLDGR